MSINPGIFLPVGEFKKRVTDYLTFVKDSRKADGIAEILIPGEKSERHRQECLEHGISVDDDLLEQVRNLAGQDSQDLATE